MGNGYREHDPGRRAVEAVTNIFDDLHCQIQSLLVFDHREDRSIWLPIALDQMSKAGEHGNLFRCDRGRAVAVDHGSSGDTDAYKATNDVVYQGGVVDDADEKVHGCRCDSRMAAE